MRTPNQTPDPPSTELLESLDLELDGALEPSRQAALAAALAGDAQLAVERARVARLHQTLIASRVPVADGFNARVMAALPAAGWEARHPRQWLLPVALIVALLVAAGLIVGLADGAAAPGAPVAAAVAAIGDLLASSAVAGAGLLGATWRGVGLAVGEVLAASTATKVALLGLMVGLNGWLLLLVRRRPAAVSARGRRG